MKGVADAAAKARAAREAAEAEAEAEAGSEAEMRAAEAAASRTALTIYTHGLQPHVACTQAATQAATVCDRLLLTTEEEGTPHTPAHPSTPQHAPAHASTRQHASRPAPPAHPRTHRLRGGRLTLTLTLTLTRRRRL